MSKLTDFQVLVFDVYGTLVDWETGIYEGLRPLLSRYSTSSKWTAKEALVAFEAVEKDLQVKYPDMLYRDLLAKAHEVLDERLKAGSDKAVESTTLEGNPATLSSDLSGSTSGEGTSNPQAITLDEHVAFGQSIKDWRVFPDSTEALHSLSKHYKLVVLSNVDRGSFSYTLGKLSEGSSSNFDPEIYKPPPTVSSADSRYWFPQETSGSKSPFTLILTAQDVQSYKPAVHGFEVALDVIRETPALLNTPKEKVLWVAQSLFHDVEPASKIGVKSVWINRKGAHMGLMEGPGEPKYTWSFNTLGEMAEAVRKE